MHMHMQMHIHMHTHMQMHIHILPSCPASKTNRIFSLLVWLSGLLLLWSSFRAHSDFCLFVVVVVVPRALCFLYVSCVVLLFPSLFFCSKRPSCILCGSYADLVCSPACFLYASCALLSFSQVVFTVRKRTLHRYSKHQGTM